MSQSAITTAFENYLASQLAAGEPVTLDQFIFANVPDLEPDVPIDRENEVIPVDYIVYQQAVTLPGVINENEVVYSVTMGTDVGDFDFNWIGLVNQATGLLAMVTHAPVQQKFMNAAGQQGNTLTRSFLMEYSGAAVATNITTPAETWQIDFTARLMSMDDRQRLENTDIYGDGAFFDDGFLVTGNLADGYLVGQGRGYVGGLRVDLSEPVTLDAGTLPTMVWVDASWKGTLTSIWQTEATITATDTLENYVDDLGVAHYVYAVASIDVDGAITDLRPQGSRDNQQLSDYLRINQNLAEIAGQGAAAQAKARGNIGCGTAAAADVQTSKDDVATGKVVVNGGAIAVRSIKANAANGDVVSADDLPSNAVSFVYGGAEDSPNISGSLLDFSGLSGGYNTQIVASYNGGNSIKFRTHNGDSVNSWNPWYEIYHTGKKPTAADVGAVAKTGDTMTGALTVQLDGAGVHLKTRSNGQSLYLLGSDADNTNLWYIGKGSKDIDDVIFNNYKSGARYNLYHDGSASVVAGGHMSTFKTDGTFVPFSYTNFDGRYVSGVQLGAEVSYTRSGEDFTYRAGGGSVMTGINIGSEGGEEDEFRNIYSKPVQRKIAGVWATVGG